MTAELEARLASVRRGVTDAAERAGRDPADVEILLATKTVPAEIAAAAVRAGYPLLGENRVQELVAKGEQLPERLAGLPFRLHVIGRLQSNKVNAAVRWASGVQSVHSLELAERLSRAAQTTGRVLDVFVQVNVSGELSKSGIEPQSAVELARLVGALPALRLSGFMTIGLNSPDQERVRAGYRELRRLRDQLADRQGEPMGLSMGMSGDFEIAIAEGATMVRIGSAAFGERPAAG